MGTTSRIKAPRPRKDKRRLASLIEEATVDAHDEEEQATGFLTMLQERMPLPFEALAIGERVRVKGFDLNERGDAVVAVIIKKGQTFRVDLLALEPEQPPPTGVEWIEAYRLWANGGR